jgi:CheY-like chemotaxis protein
MPTRILIAEDNPAVRAALNTFLKSSGPWEIVDAENGEQAVAKAQEFRPNLIILDLVMPVMDGLNAARQISKLLPEIPILMHTMHWSAQVEVEAQKVGVRKVISKADNRLLISTIQQFLTPESSPELSLSISAATERLADLAIPNTAPPASVIEACIEACNATAPEKSQAPEKKL